MKIPFSHVPLLAYKHKSNIKRVLEEIIKDGSFLNGKQNDTFIKSLQGLLKKGYITTVSSGHDALLLAMLALNIQKEDEIIFPVNSYPTVFPLAQTHGKLIPIDVDENGQIHIEEIKKHMSKQTKVIVVVHMYGLCTDVKKIADIAKKNNVFLVEDCAQSLGTTFNNQPLGTFGDISCFSFYPTKNLGTLGDGGAIWTKHKKIINYIIQAKSYGEKKRYDSNFVSGHSRMPEIQAGILNTYLKSFSKRMKKRKIIKKWYNFYIHKYQLHTYIRVFTSHSLSKPAQHLFVIEAKKRDKLLEYLQKKGIECFIHYPKPIHILDAFKHLKYKKRKFPFAEALSKKILSLPFHEYLSKEKIATIVLQIRNFYAEN